MRVPLFKPTRVAIILGIVLALTLGTIANSYAGDLPVFVNGKHMMWGMGQGYPSTQEASANNLIYHGGLVETTPAVYIVYWGLTWQSGFSFSHGGYTYTNKTVDNYVNSFFGNVVGSPWAGGFTA